MLFGNLIHSISKFGERVRKSLVQPPQHDLNAQLAGAPGQLNLGNEFFAVKKGATTQGVGSGRASKVSNVDEVAALVQKVNPKLARYIASLDAEDRTLLTQYSREKGGTAALDLLHYLHASPSKDRKNWLERICKGSLDPKLLRGVVQWAQTEDLTALSQQLQMRWPSDGAVAQLQQLQLQEGRIKRTSLTTQATKDGLAKIAADLPLCVGLSGQPHFDRDNLVFLSLHSNVAHVDAAIGFADGVTNLFEVFQPERFGPRDAKTRESRVRGRIVALLNEIGFEGLKDLEKPTQTIGYTYATRDMELYQNVQNLIKELSLDLARMPRQRSEITSFTESLNRVLDMTGQPLQWCRAKITQDPHSVPEEIQLALREIDNSTSESATHLAHQAVVAYYLLNQFVNKEVAFSNCAAVLTEYKALPSNDPLRTTYDHAVNEGLAKINHVLGKAQHDVSLTEVRQVYAAVPVDRIGAALNKRALDREGEGFREVPARMKPFFFTDENVWQEYCRGGKIGQREFFATVYGRKYGQGRDGVRVISIEELHLVRDALLLQQAHPDEARLLRVMAPAEFREMLRGLNLVRAKMRSLDAELAQAKVALSDDPRVSPSWLNPGTALDEKRIAPSLWGECIFLDAVPFPEESKLTVREIIERAKSRQGFLSLTIPVGSDTETTAHRSDDESMKRLLNQARAVKDDLPASALATQWRAIDAIVESPVVVETELMTKLRRKAYFTPEDVKAIDDVVALGNTLIAEKLDVRSLTKGEAARLKELLKDAPPTYVALEAGVQFNVLKRTIVDALDAMGVRRNARGGDARHALVHFYPSRATLFGALTKLKTDYVKATTLPKGWVAKAVGALSQDKAAARKRLKFPWTSTWTGELVGKFTENGDWLVSNELIRRVSQLITALEKPYVPPVAKYLRIDAKKGLVLSFPARKDGVSVQSELESESPVFNWVLAQNAQVGPANSHRFDSDYITFCRAASRLAKDLARAPDSSRARLLATSMQRLTSMFEELCRESE